MKTYSEEQIKGIKERISNFLLEFHEEGDRTSIYSKFQTLMSHMSHMEQLEIVINYNKNKQKELEACELKLKNVSPTWIYVGFTPEKDGDYYTKNDTIMVRNFCKTKGWTPNAEFDEWLLIPELH